MSKKALTLIQKARTQLLLNHPFFAQVILETKYHFTDTVDTMATDGRLILINPEFVETLKEVKYIQTVLAHEAMHILGMHHLRIEDRDHARWNYATDYAINDLLKKEKFEFPPEPFAGLHNPNYAKMSAEQVYSILPQQPNDGGNGSKQGDGIGGVHKLGELSDKNGNPRETDEPAMPSSAEDMKLEEQRVKELATKAATVAKMQGKLPGHIERMVDDMIATKTPWQDLLRQFMTKPSKDDYSWASPNRRFVYAGMYLPGIVGNNGMGKVVVAVDTSGSIGQRELSTFTAQIRAIAEDASPESITVLYFDSKIAGVETFEEPDSFAIDLHPVGGGGTDFRPIFNWIDDNQLQPEVLVVLTDMYASAPDHPPHYDTIWAALPGSAPHTPFGQRIDLEWENAA